MKILIATSEVSPLAKTGGLADVCGALPKALKKLGHEPVIFLPAYHCTRKFPMESTNQSVSVWINGREYHGLILKCEIPQIDVPVYLIEHNMFFDREGLYNWNNEDYGDNCERFVFFSRAVLEAIRVLNLEVDILHVNDWQTSLIPAILELQYRQSPGYEKISTLLTIHNMAYQGNFPAQAMSLTGLHWKYFNWLQMECFDQLNFLKTGIVFSDGITTVSPNYAKEIMHASGGFGLNGVLQSRKDSLWGIVNGIDTDEWNPQTDIYIFNNYDINTAVEKKANCKVALQKQLRLPERPEVPMVGLVGRLSYQKGYDIAIELIHQKGHWEDIQWVLLGSGDPDMEGQLYQLAAKYPHRVSTNVCYSNEMAHQIIAACDIFLMPSRFEPCGLTQLYSERYGTIPVVHATGGLVDTVTDMNDETIKNKTATGIHFRYPDVAGATWAIERAVATYRYNRPVWEQMMNTGMTTDFSWQKSAEKYVKIYEKIRRKVPKEIFSFESEANN
ncbi:MAG: glycogen synthase GlgA [Planctomycetia bacterium]|nr:glycogen synthase GlgA [Planctomycetia bacterium]